MSLSPSVLDSLKDAESSLRNALAYAARQERPIVCTQISRLISDIEGIQSFENILDKIDSSLK
jgi:hypothetical protein